MTRVNIVVFCLLALFLCGCDNSEKILNMETEIVTLKNKVIQLETRDYRLQNIERRLDAERTVSFDFTGKGYGKLESTSGFFLILVDDVKTFADGVTVALRIGNPLFSKFNGFKFHAKYGRREPEFPKDYLATGAIDLYVLENKKWKEELQEVNLSFTEELLPGSWNRASMLLPKIKSSDLGYLELSMETDTIALTNRDK